MSTRQYKIKGKKLIITIDYLDPSEPSIPKRPLNIPVSNAYQGMRTDFAYGKVYLIEKALKLLKPANRRKTK